MAARRALQREWRGRVVPVLHGLRDRRRDGHSNTGEDAVIERLLSGVDVRRFCVDICAGVGRTMSNTLALYERAGGVSRSRWTPDSFRALAALHARFPDSALLRGRVTPDNVLDVLRAAETPRDFGVLSLDIDGYDHFVLDRVLEEYRPALICSEINEKIPPPLRFTVRYSPEYTWGTNHFYGQSISQPSVLCERHGYDIVELEYNNALLMRWRSLLCR